jgi:hypothetical protein
MRLIALGALHMVAALVVAAALAGCEGTIHGPSGDDDDDGIAEPDASPPSESGPMITLPFSESSGEVMNPERGYYVGYNLRNAGSAASIRANGHSLAIALVNLEDYRTRSLDSAVLTAIGNGFARVREAGIKVVLRFTYNSSFSEDASKQQILTHITQLTPLLQANADVISVMQAGFIGAWGEWHGSTNGLENDVDRTDILNAILAALPASRQVQVRTPMFKEAAFGPALAETTAYDGSPASRVGHHNDCFLASSTDMGTYDAPVETWEDYVSDDGRYTAIGGETCKVYPARTDCAPALAEMEANHWSYLNLQYHQSVVAGWDDQGCGDEIRARLGYRFALDRVSHSEAVAPGGELTLELELHNSGFASPYNRRPVEIVLTDGTTRHVVQLAQADARRWAPGERTVITTVLRVPADLAPGTYTLAVRLPDDSASLAEDPRYAIQLANDDLWDDVTGDNVLTRAFTVDASAPGPVDPSATSFIELH